MGDEIDVRVEKGVYRGLGLARHEGQVVLVPRGLPGDRFRVRVASASRGLLRVAPLERLEDGPGRRPSPCSVSDACGGCAYQDLDYSRQLILKELVLRESLARAGAPFEGEIRLAPSPERGWRTRASLHCAYGDDAFRLGLHAEGSHRIVEFGPCLQLSARANAAVQGLRQRLPARAGLASRVASVDLAESTDGGEVVLGFRGDLRADDGPALAATASEIPEITGIGFVTGRGGNGPFVLLRGDPYVHAQILGRRLRAHLRSFFQANRFLVEDLARSVLEMVPSGGTVLDLYSGAGLFSVPLAARGDEVRGVEINEGAVRDAVANARGLGSARFSVAEVGADLSRSPRETAGTIVLDPPRTGAGREVVAGIASRRPRVVVYVSCDPPTLGRDLADFARAGLRPDRIRAFDMFPDTFHVEAVVRLVPA